MVDIICLSTCIAFPSQDFVIPYHLGFVQLHRDWFRYINSLSRCLKENREKKKKSEWQNSLYHLFIACATTASIEANIENGVHGVSGVVWPTRTGITEASRRELIVSLHLFGCSLTGASRARGMYREYGSMIEKRRRLGSVWQFIYLCNIINCVTLAGDGGVNEKAPKINSANKFDVFELICARGIRRNRWVFFTVCDDTGIGALISAFLHSLSCPWIRLYFFQLPTTLM